MGSKHTSGIRYLSQASGISVRHQVFESGIRYFGPASGI